MKRNPYDVALLVAFLLAGVAGLLLPSATSSNTLMTMSTQLLYVWHAVSAIGGGIGLIGAALLVIPQRWLLGNVFLRYGLGLVAVQLAGYGLALAGLFNLKSFFISAILLTFAGVAWGRVWRISRDISDFRKAYQSQVEGVDGLEHRPPGRGDPGGSGGIDAPMADPEVEGRHREDDG